MKKTSVGTYLEQLVYLLSAACGISNCSILSANPCLWKTGWGSVATNAEPCDPLIPFQGIYLPEPVHMPTTNYRYVQQHE